MAVLTLVLLGFATVLVIPIALLFLEVLAALDPVRAPSFAEPAQLHHIAVVVPAHNESSGIIPTIRDIQSQLSAADRLLVVADNCSDDTAAVAAAEGCEVLTRNDASKTGKGYALAWSIEHLRANPPDFVIFIDADCRIQSDMIWRLAQACASLKRPLQACFLMKQADNSPIDHSLAEFAWVLKNWVRPLGLRSLKLPVQLMGTGMIFSWRDIQNAPLSSGHLVEDMKLGLDLAARRNAPLFFPFVVGISEFPQTTKGTESQRQRWVKGHLGMIARIPRLLIRAAIDRNPELFVLTLDLLIPPLSLLGLLITFSLVLNLVAVAFGISPVPAFVAIANLLVFATCIGFAWLRFGRDIIRPAKFLLLGSMALKRLILYCQILLGRTASGWIRTDRGTHDPK